MTSRRIETNELNERVERLNNHLLINFQRGFWTASAKLPKELLGQNVPQKIVRGSQDLLPDKTLVDDIRTIQNKAKYCLKNQSLPFPFDSVFRIKPEKFLEVEEELITHWLPLHDERVDVLCDNMAELKKTFKKKYPKYYRPELYPDKKDLKSRFYIRWIPFQFAIPEKGMSSFDSKTYRTQLDRIKNTLDEMEEMTLTVIGNDLLKRLDNLHSKCTGKGETLHGKTVGSINRFIEKWDDLWRGEVDDKKLNMIVGRLRREMSKVSIDRLKDNAAFRKEVQGKVGKMIDRLQTLPNVELRRSIDL